MHRDMSDCFPLKQTGGPPSCLSLMSSNALAVPSKNRHLGKKSLKVLAALRTVAEKIPRLDSKDKLGEQVGEVPHRSVISLIWTDIRQE